MSGEFTATPLEIRVFTTRPDTIFGATYLVLAPEHPLVDADRRPTSSATTVDAYVARAAKQDLVTRKTIEGEDGRLHRRVRDRIRRRGKPIPIWIADYVLMEYGTGAIMAVPGHDERDFEFATRVRSADRARRRGRRRSRPTTPLDEAFTETDGVRARELGALRRAARRGGDARRS